MERLSKFHKLASHPYYNALYGKLTLSSMGIAVEFISSSQGLSKDDWTLKVNRLFLDKEKPKQLTIISDLLLACA